MASKYFKLPKKLIVMAISLAYVMSIFCTNTYAYYVLTNSDKDKSLFGTTHELGDWEFISDEDPFTDELTYKVCKNSDDRYTSNNNTVSSGMLCVSYIPKKQKLSVYIRYEGSFQRNPADILIRFGKDKPQDLLLDVDNRNIDLGNFAYFPRPMIVVDEILKNKKIAIKIRDYNDSKGKDKIFIFSPSGKTFENVSKPIFDNIK